MDAIVLTKELFYSCRDQVNVGSENQRVNVGISVQRVNVGISVLKG